MSQPGPPPYAAHSPNVAQPGPPAARSARESRPLALAIASITLGIPLTAIAVAAGTRPVGVMGLAVIWIAIAVINVPYALSTRPPSHRC